MTGLLSLYPPRRLAPYPPGLPGILSEPPLLRRRRFPHHLELLDVPLPSKLGLCLGFLLSINCVHLGGVGSLSSQTWRGLGSFHPRLTESFQRFRLQESNLLPSVINTDALPNELNLLALTLALPVVPSPFEPQNSTRVMAFIPGGILPGRQESGGFTLLPSSCQPPLFAKTRVQLTTGWDFFLFRLDRWVLLCPQGSFSEPSLCPP